MFLIGVRAFEGKEKFIFGHFRILLPRLTEPEHCKIGICYKTYGKADFQSLLDDVVYKTEPMEELTTREAYGEKLPKDIIPELEKHLKHLVIHI